MPHYCNLVNVWNYRKSTGNLSYGIVTRIVQFAAFVLFVYSIY